jgi:SPP1 gp7 family putative phage head morphogenesis protein
MIAYDLARLAGVSRPVLLPPIHDSPGNVRSYLAILRRMLKALGKAVVAELMPLAEREKQRLAATTLTRDLTAEDFTSIETLGRALARIAALAAARVFRAEANRHTARFIDGARQALGVDLTAVVREEDVTAYLDACATRNALLIRDLADDAVKKVVHVVIDGVINGISARQTRKDIAEVMSTSDSRAQLIARDQSAKLTADLNRFRHQQAGVTDYYWRTAHDERVRSRHRRIDGTRYTYGGPTGAERGLPPGQPISCRCIAQGIVE